jgi:hypothetical protein
MAVGRIKLTARQHRTIAARLKPHRSDTAVKRLYNEIHRASTRPGLSAELMPRELDAIIEIASDMPEVVAVVQAEAERVAQVEAMDEQRVADRRAMMDRVRGASGGGVG